MASQWLRRSWLLACASALLLAGCGGGGDDSDFTPTRIVTFGDAFADVGQNGARYTVNDTAATINNWTLYTAQQYGLPLLTPSATGGTAYAIGNARVTSDVDAAGGSATPVVKQIDAFLAANGNRVAANDLVIVNAGTSDVIVHGRTVLAAADNAAAGTAQTAALTAVGQAGRELGAQVRRLVNAGGQRVVVVGTYNLGRSGWAQAATPRRDAQLQDLSQRFNDQLLVSLVDLGESVLYVDAGLHYNLVTGSPGSYGFSNAKDAVCTGTAVDPGPGIGIGNGQVNSNRCTKSTLRAGVTDPDTYLFADLVYPTGRGQRSFGEYAIQRIRDRW